MTYKKNQSVVEPKNFSQSEYIDCIRRNTLTFGLGPAGTGKTFIAVATAVDAILAKRVEKLILTRPAIETGEKLGFLPGSFADKIDPYMQPLIDSLNKLLGKATVDKWRKENKIEIAPVAYMRGRTFESAFVIADEAQNCTWEQLMMIATRLGEDSQMVFTGDEAQSDIYNSGLTEFAHALSHLPGVGVYRFDPTAVVRHPLVTAIIEAVATR